MCFDPMQFVFQEILPKLKSSGLDDVMESVWIVGGNAVYKHVMDTGKATHIYITRVHKRFDCDTFFPEINADKYVRVLDGAVDNATQTEEDLSYTFEVYERADSHTLPRKE
jgi:dihydrofolate reductase